MSLYEIRVSIEVSIGALLLRTLRTKVVRFGVVMPAAEGMVASRARPKRCPLLVNTMAIQRS